MIDQSPARRAVPRLAVGIGLLAAGAVAGGILAGTLSASASEGSNGPTTANGAGTAPHAAGLFHRGGPAPVRSDEQALTGALAAKVRAAALEAVPGGTVYRVETDAGDGTYEAHMTKADGTPVTVKFDKSVTTPRVETGMGRGDPAPSGQPPMR